MGQFIEGLPSLSPPHPKRTSIDPDLFSTSSTNDTGKILSKLSDSSICLLTQREVQQSSLGRDKEKRLEEWISQSYKYACNVLQYQLHAKSMLCNQQVSLKLLFQYGRGTLYSFLNQKEEGGNGQGLECSRVTKRSQAIRFQTPLERMGFLRLLIDIVQEQQTKDKQWTCFHSKNLIYFPKEKAYKLFHLLPLDDSSFSEAFFAPEEAGQHPTEHSCVFSMGMILLSLFLGEDSSECYNFQNFTFCQSIFEDRIERLKESMITRGLMGILDDQSRYVPQFQEEVSELVLLMTAPKEERLCFAEVKRRYLWLIRKASMSYAPSDHHTQTHTRSVLEPLTSKRAGRQGRSMKNKAHPNIGCFSTNQDLHFRTTITQANESDFFVLSRSNVRMKQERKTSLGMGAGGGKKGQETRRDNQALVWKKAIVNRMKEHKENMPYYQEESNNNDQ